MNNDENIALKIKNETITNSSNEKLLDILFNNKFDFDEHVTSLCRKASQKLNVLARVAHYMNLAQRMLIMNIFILSQFGYCPLVWMFHSRKLNNRINNIHERSLRIVYRDYLFILFTYLFSIYLSLTNFISSYNQTNLPQTGRLVSNIRCDQ